jgi:hypothetical protein
MLPAPSAQAVLMMGTDDKFINFTAASSQLRARKM